MKRLVAYGVACVVLAAALPVKADDVAPWNWTGTYIGAHVGAASGAATFPNPFGPSIYGKDVSTPAFLGGVQAGHNWQVPGSAWVLGGEADISGLVSDGTNTCLANSGFFVSANCRVRPDITTTIRSRGASAMPPGPRAAAFST